MLGEDQSELAIGLDSLMSIGHAEIIDSIEQFEQYLRSVKSTIEIEEGQMLVVHV